jgi:hypothetical protein
MPKQKLRVGLLLDAGPATAWLERLVAGLAEADFVNLCLVVWNAERPSNGRFARLRELSSRLLFVHESDLAHVGPDPAGTSERRSA